VKNLLKENTELRDRIEHDVKVFLGFSMPEKSESVAQAA
jgi:hypothetical protein